MPCSQPGPAATVQVPIQIAVPSTPSSPYKISSNVEDSTANLIIGWGSVPNATSYELEHSGEGVVYRGSVTQATIRNLALNAPYTVRVRACNAAGCSPWSAWVTLYTATPPMPSAPGAPYKVSQQCTGGGYASVTIGWAAATNAKYYQIFHTGGEYGPWITPDNRTQFTITGINSWPPWGANLTLYVEACNAAGQCVAGPAATLWIDPC